MKRFSVDIFYGNEWGWEILPSIYFSKKYFQIAWLCVGIQIRKRD